MQENDGSQEETSSQPRGRGRGRGGPYSAEPQSQPRGRGRGRGGGRPAGGEDMGGVLLTELSSTVQKGDVTEIEALISRGATVNGRTDYNGWAAMHHAASWGKPEAATVLLNHGAKTHVPGNDGKTPLHYATHVHVATDEQPEAALQRYSAVIVLLVNHDRGSVDVKDNCGWTPLHSAVQEGHMEVARLLISLGATVDVEDMGGRTVFDYTTDDEMLTILRGAQKKKKTPAADDTTTE